MITPSDDKITKIIAGENAAIEAYKAIREEIPSGAAGQRVMQMQRDHEQALEFWRAQANKENVNAKPDTELWNKAIKGVVNVSSKVNENLALTALKTGEEQWMKYYQDLLNSEELSPFHKDQIRNKFIPEHETHIVTLNSLTKVA